MEQSVALLASLLEKNPQILALVAGLGFVSHALAFLADSRKTFHRIAMVLRFAADVLDRAPAVAADIKAGDLPKAAMDAQGGQVMP